MLRRGARPRLALLALGLAMGGLAACGDEGGRPELSWYINPDDGGQAEIAARCTAEAGGRYTIETSLLPNDASSQREQLLRRLAAEDSAMDIMSLDPVVVPEFAEAGFLMAIPDDIAAELTEGVFESSVLSSTWNDELIAAPFWANTQLLWFRRSVAEQAGLDPDAEAVTWEQLVEAAQQTGTTIGVQANRYEGYAVWINALVESAGGHIIENPGAAGDEIEFGLDSPAGQAAVDVIGAVATGGIGGPSLSTSIEEDARTLFQGPSGGFMVNWPYVWRAANAAVDGGSLGQDVLDDIGWALYPRVSPDLETRPPLGGINLGISSWSNHQDLALEAVRCITRVENTRFYMLNDGNPSARAEVFDDPEIQANFPMAGVIRDSLEQAGPRPRTQYYGDVSGALVREFHPPGSVDAGTPAAAEDLIRGVLRGDRLL